ncbi:hypothetical protein, partial [Agrobacterium vitis]|uniref:hypothetical protein n=1 Tax=Agrobacterium vitis TaxID=373 RepID=UPI001AEDCBA0
PITRTCFALCNPGQRRAIQVLIVNTGVNIGRRYGVNFPRRLTENAASDSAISCVRAKVQAGRRGEATTSRQDVDLAQVNPYG